MNTWQLAEDFRNGLVGLAGFAEAEFRTGQSEAEETTNSAIIDATDEPFSANGKTGKFTLTVSVKTHAEDATAAQHAARVKTMRDALLDPAAKAALIAALNGLGNFTIKGYSALAEEGGVERSAFETPVRITGTAVEL